MNRSPEWPSLDAWVYPEPLMLYNQENIGKVAINQLKGLVKYGPIDYSYAPLPTRRESIKIAVLAPNQKMQQILSHLNKLNNNHNLTGKDAFLPNYIGFEKAYRRSLSIPDKEKDICIGYNENSFSNKDAKEFIEFLKRGIDYFSNRPYDFLSLIHI